MSASARAKLLIGTDDNYDLIYTPAEAKVELISKKNQSVYLAANFKFDSSDGAALLSNFQYVKPKQENLALVVADWISDYLAGEKNGCKLFCIPTQHQSEFTESKEYRCENIDRLMLREAKTTTTAPSLPTDVKIESLDTKLANISDITQLKALLKQHTYWGNDVDEEYVRKALENSKYFLVARDKDHNIIGMVRAPSNQDFVYVSDMAVHPNWRRKNIGTVLMHQLCQLIDKQHPMTALIRAKEGDGLAAGPKLYGDKFGFVEYKDSHRANVYFRYVKLTPEKVERNKFLLSMSPVQPNVATASPTVTKPQSSHWSLGKTGMFAGALIVGAGIATQIASHLLRRRH